MVIVATVIGPLVTGMSFVAGRNGLAFALLRLTIMQVAATWGMIRMMFWSGLLGRSSTLNLWPSRFYWAGIGLLYGGWFLVPNERTKTICALTAIALFIIDWWWGGPGRHQRKKAVATVLKVRQALAWGVPARRPAPA